VKPGGVTRVLTSGNTWWQDPGWVARDVQLRAAARSPLSYRPDVLLDLPRGGLVLLRGPRRVGKSVELKRTVQRLIGDGTPPRAVIHAAVDGWRAGDLRDLVGVGKRLVPADVTHRYWLIDEVSAVPGWADAVKHLRDNDPEFADDTVVLTGSSAADLTAARKSLVGRRGPVSRPDRTLLPMGFRSFADSMLASRGAPTPDAPPVEPPDLRTPDARQVLDGLVPWLDDLANWWEIYLHVGGFPQAVSAQLSGGDLDVVVQALLDVVQRDALAEASLSTTQVTAMLDRLARGLCSPVNVTSLATDVGISHDTARRRLEDLAAAFVLWPCHQSQGMLPKLRAQSKWYFVDPMFSRLAHTRSTARAEPDLTQLTEQQIGAALLRSHERRNPGTFVDFDGVLYARTPARKEVDFIGPALGNVAVEGKYTDGDRWRAEAATVNSSPHEGILATRTVLDTSGDSPDQAWAVPAALLAYLIDV
jgi:hypothetical protein